MLRVSTRQCTRQYERWVMTCRTCCVLEAVLPPLNSNSRVNECCDAACTNILMFNPSHCSHFPWIIPLSKRKQRTKRQHCRRLLRLPTGARLAERVFCSESGTACLPGAVLTALDSRSTPGRFGFGASVVRVHRILLTRTSRPLHSCGVACLPLHDYQVWSPCGGC